ncbi:MAG: 23S rRNA (guanosine(2251)-2'-O)-methyltransferase RlmB [Parvibaculum sp.]|nr:23S rRNA (guanosine(2251)-2'-O)-methyltransferase RlmB [Parvibaculum sp.]|tara:strand:+ start:232 stop:1050 length:819 start_codon:yes stop_codon:yes gene_type:complete
MTKRKQPRAQSGEKTPKNRGKRRPGAPGTSNNEAASGYLYGIHAVTAALSNEKRRIAQLICTSGVAKDLEASGLTGRIKPTLMQTGDISELLPPGAVHQGVAIKTNPLHEPDLDQVMETANRLALLDQVTDPHNVGAILRSAAVFGISSLVMTDRNSPPQSGVLAKSASGALEHISICRVSNLSRSIETLIKQGFTIIGLDGDAEHDLNEIDAGEKVALVLGAEGVGLRRLTREKCDWLAKLPATGPMRSLNVSNAAAVAFYELARKNWLPT